MHARPLASARFIAVRRLRLLHMAWKGELGVLITQKQSWTVLRMAMRVRVAQTTLQL